MVPATFRVVLAARHVGQPAHLAAQHDAELGGEWRVVVDRAPPTELGEALAAEGVEVQIAT